MHYFDHIAATPLDPRVFEAMRPFFGSSTGSTLSLHRRGQAARLAVETARGQVAALIGALPGEIVFTANGTEASNMAIKGIARAYEKSGRHIIVSSIEHQSVLYPAKTMERQGFEVTQVPVDRCGQVDPRDVQRALRDDTILVSVMHASDEIGTVQALRDICALAQEQGIQVHTDAVCTAGVIPVDVKDLEVDALTLSPQHMNGPPGVGALYLRDGVRIRPLLDGGIQEGGRRAGHENVPAIAGFGAAAELAGAEMGHRAERVAALRERLHRELVGHMDGLHLNGHPENRLPGHLSLTIRDADSESMVLMLDAQDIAVSLGSSCSSQASKASHVLLAIGLSPREIRSTLVITLGYTNTVQDIDCVVKALPDVVMRLRQIAGSAGLPTSNNK
ncbi:MAG: cysteine desulfurase family protein [Gemmatimonadota bacterium]|nr:cysteine desulfurase family protein [Gemmatimonadota bacterium]